MERLYAREIVEAFDEHDKVRKVSAGLPGYLDGSSGSNRAIAVVPQIRATNDLEAVSAWLSSLQKKGTFDNYRREAERLLLWATSALGKPISSLTVEDFIAYRNFLADPQPSEQWVMTGKKLPRSSPGWRPFTGKLSLTSQKQTMTILKTMMAWLVNGGYLSGNPLDLLKTKLPSDWERVERYLDAGLWAEVKTTILTMPRRTKTQVAAAIRTRWVFSLLYLCGLRISELVENNMGGFSCTYAANDTVYWWLTVIGKGGKKRRVPVSRELMQELATYRESLGLSPIPAEGDPSPLVLPLVPPKEDKMTKMTRGGLHLVVKQVFVDTAERIDAQATSLEAQCAAEQDPVTKAEMTARVHALRSRAKNVEKASAHWLRHTAGSNLMAAGAQLLHVRDNFGHSSLTTTNGYLHTEEEERHRGTAGVIKLTW